MFLPLLDIRSGASGGSGTKPRFATSSWACRFVGVLVLAGASVGQFATLMTLYLALVATEALNTAIECIVDHRDRMYR